MYNNTHQSGTDVGETLFTLALLVFLILLIIRAFKRHKVEDAHHTSDPTEMMPDESFFSPPQPESTRVPGPNILPKGSVKTINDVKRGSLRAKDKEEQAEIDVDMALQKLDHGRYIVFRDLIIPTGKRSPSLTQIDHVVVSVYGVFCIETKSNSGYIYGYTRADKWTQYLAREKYLMNSPFRQNMHHVKSVERYLHGMLRAPVHSYLAFPNASKVVIDGVDEDASIVGVMSKIQRHTHKIYDSHAVVHIAKTLAHMASKRDELRHRHIDDVTKYLNNRVYKI